MLGPWKCSKCGTINGEGNLCGCGLSRARVIYNELLIKRLFVDTGPSGHTNWEILQRYAWSYATRKNLPSYLVEDAFGKAIERLVASIDTYDINKGKFLTWAISFVKNELRTAARKDVEESNRIEVSIDLETETGELLAEAIEGDSFGLDDLIDLEESQREREAKRRIASSMLGEFVAIVKGRFTKIPVYTKALEIFYGMDGDENEWGWISELEHKTKVDRRVLSARIERAAGLWERVSKEIMGM